MTPVAIIDPALGHTGAHNQGFADLLVEQGADAGKLGIWCHASIGQPLRDRLTASGVAVQPVFSTDRRLNYRLAFHSLDALPNTRVYASCGDYAQAYARLLERSAPLPGHPCFVGDRIDRSAIDEAYRRTLFTPFWQWLERGRPSNGPRARNGGQQRAQISDKDAGTDIVVFWKQNDSTLYGRRIDMVVRYLASRSDIRRVVVVDAPIGDSNLAKLDEDRGTAHHGRAIHARTLKKQAGAFDVGKIAYKVYVCPLKHYRFREDGSARPRFIEGYIEFLQDVFSKEGIDPRQAVFWIYPRNFHAPALLRKFDPGKVVVDVVDDDRAWPSVPEDTKRKLTENLRTLLQSADMAFANCAPVQQSMREYCPDIRLVANGCDVDPPRTLPRDEAYQSFVRRPGKVLGFVGNLEAKIDIDLLHELAKRFDECHIVLIGSTHANPKVLELSRHPNVSLPGVVPYEEIDAWLRRFDVGLIPHLDMDLTRHMNPLKAYVYLSRNIPVVATAIPNIDTGDGLVRVAHTHAAFLDQVARILAGDRPSQRAFRNYAASNSWKQRFAAHIDELLSTAFAASGPRVVE